MDTVSKSITSLSKLKPTAARGGGVVNVGVITLQEGELCAPQPFKVSNCGLQRNIPLPSRETSCTVKGKFHLKWTFSTIYLLPLFLSHKYNFFYCFNR